MHISKQGFEKIKGLSFKDVFYQTKTESLGKFFKYFPDINGLKLAIDQRKLYKVDRELLHEVLNDHYSKFESSALQLRNISLLKEESTFTVVTAHQPCILGGPAYYFYKICSVINLCTSLKEHFPDSNFIPVFINGSEDHDFDEIKNIHLFNKGFEWHSTSKGPVGRFPTDGILEIIEELKEVLGESESAHKIHQIFTSSLHNALNYNDFVFQWINRFFSNYGLLVFNMDDVRLKRKFSPVIKKELSERQSQSIVANTQNQLQDYNFKPQALARDVNLFYITEQSRERIYYDNWLFKINNSEISFTTADMLAEVEMHPERFSPNVVLRPVYQEFTLPNIAYIGGGGEVSYWLERKELFDYFKIFYPVIIRRNSVMLIPKSIQKSMEKLGLAEDDLLLDEDGIISNHLKKASDTDYKLANEITAIQDIFKGISVKAKSLDPTLEHLVLAESSKVVKMVESIEGRLMRTLKQKEETSVNQIRYIKSKLFPNLGLQERNDSLIQFMASEKIDLLDLLIEKLNPLEKEFLFIYL